MGGATLGGATLGGGGGISPFGGSLSDSGCDTLLGADDCIWGGELSAVASIGERANCSNISTKFTVLLGRVIGSACVRRSFHLVSHAADFAAPSSLHHRVIRHQKQAQQCVPSGGR